MTVVDLHPEELLDKDARGALTDVERARLDTHLARCAACRAERVLRADFSAELDAEERPSALIGLVQGALAAPKPVAAPNVSADLRPELESIGGLRRRPRRTAVVLLVAAACLAASAAGATGLTNRVWLRIRGGSQDATHASAASTSTSGPSTAAGRGGAAVARAPLAPVEPAAPAAAEIDPLAAGERVLAPAVVRAPVPAVVVPAPARAPAPAAVVAPAPAASTAMGLFEAGNAARRAGDTSGALAAYDALERQFPGTREARVAKATTGKLLLDRGDASGALARFDAYLASGSSELREEAMAGRATALERLGRGEEEGRAWAALLATYPGTPYAAHARARVERSLPR